MIYKSYLTRTTFFSLCSIATVLVLLIWFSRAISFVRYVTENGISIAQFLRLFVLILPWLLIFIIPVSLFAATLINFNRLIASNEITILKTSGLTKIQICKPVMGLAILASLVCYSISFYFMPYANKQLRLSRTDLKNNYASLSFTPQTFETLRNLTIYAQKREQNNKLFGILLHDERSNNYSITVTAKNGKIITEGNSVLLQMEDGTIQKFNYQNMKSEILNFDSYVFNLSENQKNISNKRWKAKERYLSELLNPEKELDEDDAKKIRNELHQRITNPLFSIIFTIIALSFILKGKFKREGNFLNNILAIATITAFFGLNVLFQSFENLPYSNLLPYLNITAFLIFSLKNLREKL